MLKILSVLSIDQVRETLPDVERQLSTLQALVDEAHDMTEEIEILLESLPPEHPHVVEMSELLEDLLRIGNQTIQTLNDMVHVLQDSTQVESNGLVSLIIN